MSWGFQDVGSTTSYIGWIFLSEMLGSMLLVMLGNGVVAAVNLKTSKARGAGWSAIAIGWGLAVFVGAITSQYSGAHLNFAVTLSVLIQSASNNVGNNPFANGHQWLIVIYLVAQFTGMIIGQLLLDLVYWLQIEKSDAGEVLGFHCTAPAQKERSKKTYAFNTFAEFMATFVLVLGLGAASLYTGTGHNFGSFNLPASSLIGVGIAMAVVAGVGYGLGGPTGFAINPTRDLAPRIVHHFLPLPNKGSSDWAYSWVPVVGPVLGGVVGGALILAMMH
ncbi:MIP/aquaporin family protein [Mesoplasma whartonense]|uniref:MIP/aquaporin family protein n=1 Tax=Mesoplasma whartonense TaxID=2878854 RepID=UPI002022A9A9|nr:MULTISPECIES: MIP/aquaporin family protein [unclassified Mesoplasma]MCL8212555.1 putative glycerol uptake facilitator protein [Mesoplasma sp. JKS002661]MCL8213323.1 putative glycerol uptake facilitator protein [Mesoplasma sp. JKS002660]MCL8215977.1 putative glycerol uptake facilitator protein [Mesoplasma sp. JKS002657]